MIAEHDVAITRFLSSERLHSEQGTVLAKEALKTPFTIHIQTCFMRSDSIHGEIQDNTL
jgi:hypothetical protein